MAKYVLDRYEGDWAILEDEEGRMLKVGRETLPQASEGEALEEEDGRWRIDPERTEQLRSQARARMARLKRHQ